MTKGFQKKTSKRIPAKRRYKIEKKVREHSRKMRKEAKKQNLKRKPKDPGIPNSLPFKEKILNELQEEKKRADEYRQLMKAQQKQKRTENREKLKSANRGLNLEELAKSAQERGAEFEEEHDQGSAQGIMSVIEKDPSNLKSFFKDVQKVIEASDIIIEVLDARDPLGTRCFEVENTVTTNYSNKRIILLLNKCDLIPRDNLKKWLTYLRNQYVTIPFKASTQNQKQNLARSKVDILLSPDDYLKSSKCFGADFVMKILNNYCRNKDIKTSITVGIVGFPNVGKSSIINSLKRSQVCNVGAMPGLTKAMQTISLDKNIKLLDSPGIVFAKNDAQTRSMVSMLALRNAVKIETLEDPILPIEALLNRVNPKNLMEFYRITHFSNVKEFLNLVAKRFGKMLKGGIVDLNSAAKKVLQDWNCGNIKYYTLPPESVMSMDVKIVGQMSKEFDITNFVYDQMMNVDEPEDEVNHFVVKSMSEEDAAESVTEIVLGNSSKSTTTVVSKDVEMEELEGMQLNKSKKLQFKKVKKQRKRDAKLSNKLDQIKLQDDYDFDTYF